MIQGGTVLPRVAQFEDFAFGMFIHWGLYSLTGRGEWVMNFEGVPKREYEKLAGSFTAEKFDPAGIARAARRAGMRYIVFTARHHDGFSLYDAKGLSSFDAPHSAAGRDLVREFVDACREEGISPFLYHTTLDWNREEFSSDFQSYLGYLRSSVEILCTEYGKLGGLWFDGNWSRKDADWEEEKLYSLIRKHQPDCIIVNNTGLDALGQTGREEIDSVTFEQSRPDGRRASVGGRHIASEMCCTMNRHWGRAENDLRFRSLPELIENLCACRKNGANYLLNVGPDGGGAIPPMESAMLDGLGRWVDVCGKDAIYRGRPCGIKGENKDFALSADGKTYFFVHDLPVNGAETVTRRFDGVEGKISSLRWTDSGEPVGFELADGSLTLSTRGFGYGADTVVRVAAAD